MRQSLPSREKTAPSYLWHIADGVFLGCTLTLLLIQASQAFSRDISSAEPKTLAAVFGPVRMTQGRLAGQMVYVPYSQLLQGDPIREQLGQKLMSRAVRRLHLSLRERAFFNLLKGNLDKAIADLEGASRRAPGKATLLSDLSALYAERAHAKASPEDYVTSLEMAERAVAIDPNLAVAVFNRALALEQLFLLKAARDGWRRYLEIDAYSPWAAEARAHLAETLSNPVRQSAVNHRDLLLRKIAEAAHTELQLAGAPGITTTLQALNLVRALDEESEIAVIENRLADALAILGQSTQAWRYRYLSLAWASRVPAGRQAHIVMGIFKSAAQQAFKDRHIETALNFQSRALEVVEALGQPKDILHMRLQSSSFKIALGKQEDARRDFGLALRAFEGLPNGARESLADWLSSARQDFSEDPVARLAFPSTDLSVRLSVGFQNVDTEAVESVIGHPLTKLEWYRATIPLGTYGFFFNQPGPYYERALALRLKRGQPEEALEVLERLRGYVFLNQIREIAVEGIQTAVGNTISPLLDWRGLCRHLPEHTVIVVYAVVEGRLVTWLVRSSGIWLSPRYPDWTTVSALTWHLREAHSPARLSERTQLLKRLHAELITSWKQQLRGGERIIFVPTRELYGVPFAALLDPVSGHHLIQDHAVGVAPSASEFVAAVERDRLLSTRPLANVLLVGDPVWDRQERSGLSGIPGAQLEIKGLSRLYRRLDARVLTREQATPENVLAALGSSEIVHFGTHALNDPQDPARSGLVLSSSGSDPGELTAHHLVGRRLPRTRLVVLASCGSNSGPVSSESSLSLTHSFLAAGVPAVMGSLWEIEDASTARLAVRFHQELLRGADALTALRTVQLAEIEAGSEVVKKSP